MKLTQLASKPQLVKFELNDEETVKEYGEAIEFYSWDRQPLDVFMKLANADQKDIAGLVTIIKKLILDENGREIINDENTLPGNLMIKVIGKVVETLGK